MRKIVLDSGAFIAAERRDRAFAEFMLAADDEGAEILVPATVIAEVWRDPPRNQSSTLIRVANAVIPLTERAARIVGALLGRSKSTQLVDAHAVTIAFAERPAIIATSDPGDITALLRSAGASHALSGAGRPDVIVHPI